MWTTVLELGCDVVFEFPLDCASPFRARLTGSRESEIIARGLQGSKTIPPQKLHRNQGGRSKSSTSRHVRLQDHPDPVPEQRRRGPEPGPALPAGHHADRQRHPGAHLPQLPGRGVPAGAGLRPAHRPAEQPLREGGRAHPQEPHGQHAGLLRGRHEPLPGAGHGLPHALPGRHAARGPPLGAGHPALHPPQRRLLAPAAGLREEALRQEHRPGGPCPRAGLRRAAERATG